MYLKHIQYGVDIRNSQFEVAYVKIVAGFFSPLADLAGFS